MVAEELHFGKAAEKLCMAQPPLSLSIKNLEDEIGVKLFSRTAKNIRLTEAGKMYLEAARRVLSQVDHANEEARAIAGGRKGIFRVGFISSAGYERIPVIYQRMRARFPDVTLQLRDLTTAEQFEQIRKNQLDIGIIHPPAPEKDVHIQEKIFWREPMIIALPERHPLAAQERIAARQLKDEDFLLVSQRYYAGGCHARVVRLCLDAGFCPRVVQETRTAPTLISLVATGMGITIIPWSFKYFKRSGVVYRRFAGDEPHIELAAIWRDEESSPFLPEFLKILDELEREDA